VQILKRLAAASKQLLIKVNVTIKRATKGKFCSEKHCSTDFDEFCFGGKLTNLNKFYSFCNERAEQLWS